MEQDPTEIAKEGVELEEEALAVDQMVNAVVLTVDIPSLINLLSPVILRNAQNVARQ
jgi:hypothetical protein